MRIGTDQIRSENKVFLYSSNLKLFAENHIFLWDSEEKISIFFKMTEIRAVNILSKQCFVFKNEMIVYKNKIENALTKNKAFE